MKRKASHEVALQSGNVGYFAAIELEAELKEGPPSLVVDFADGVESWRAGALFGVAYAYEKSPVRSVRVRIASLRGHVVDTTEAVVAYAAAWAFWKALDVVPAREPLMDADHALFSFPK